MNKKIDELGETISLIERALRSCGPDFALSEVRGHLMSARHAAEHTLKKRSRRHNNQLTAAQEATQKAQNLHKEWWSKIEENVRKTAKENAEKQQDGTELAVDQ